MNITGTIELQMEWVNMPLLFVAPEAQAILPKHIIERIFVCPKTQCWIYKGKDPTPNGYQRCWHMGFRWMTHRLVYELTTRKDIRTKQLDHLCEVRACCNPDHMDPVTPKVNSKRKFRRHKRVKSIYETI